MGNVKSDEKALRDCQLAIKTDPILLQLHEQIRDFVVRLPPPTVVKLRGDGMVRGFVPEIPAELTTMVRGRISEIMSDFGVTASLMGVIK